MARLTCYYYLTESNRAPAREFVDSLDISTQRRFFFVKELLEEFGHKLPYPHAKYLRDGIFELRFHGREGAIRLLYFFTQQDKAIFTNGFIKKADKAPGKEIAVAIERRKAFLKRQKEGEIK